VFKQFHKPVSVKSMTAQQAQ